MHKIPQAALAFLIASSVFGPVSSPAQPTQPTRHAPKSPVTWGQIMSIFRRPPATARGSRPAHDVCPVLPGRNVLTDLEISGEADPATVDVLLRSPTILRWQGWVNQISIRERGNPTELWQWSHRSNKANLALQQTHYDGPELLPGKTYHITFEGRASSTVAVRLVTSERQRQLLQARDSWIARLNQLKLTPEQMTRQEVVFWGEQYQMNSEAAMVFLTQMSSSVALQQLFDEAQQDFCEGRFEPFSS